jgi:hypothetical protein
MVPDFSPSGERNMAPYLCFLVHIRGGDQLEEGSSTMTVPHRNHFAPW